MGGIVRCPPIADRHWSLLFAVLFWSAPVAATHAQQEQLDTVGFEIGDPEAPLLVVEFADFGCSACAQFARETFPTVYEELIRTGRVRWKFVPFELGAFRHSRKAIMASLCAAEQDAVWAMHDSLFSDRDRWQDPSDPFPTFLDFATGIGLNPTEFEECYRRDDTEETAKELRNLARKLRIRATPTFLVGEHRVRGALPTEMFLEMLVKQSQR
jgi:protein-disulfide isomerase